MSATRDVTGGDLNDLWRTANVALPAAANVYAQHLAATEDRSADAAKFGEFHEPWSQLAGILSKALSDTHESLNESAAALNDAVSAYAHVDGDTSKGLSTAGDELRSIIDPEGDESVDGSEGHSDG